LEGGVDEDGEDDADGEEFVGEMVVDDDGEACGVIAAAAPVESKPPVTAAADNNNNNNQEQDGEMDMDLDEGEVTDDDQPATAGNEDIAADIAAAKARLLARLEENSEAQQEQDLPAAADDDEDAADEHQERASDREAAMPDEAEARVNMRATLNMILTVAGEFYGQRDLLEFRDPFPAL
jgi:hypothetical protein